MSEDKELTVYQMSDNELLDYLKDLEGETRQRTVSGDLILEKVTTISRQLKYRNKVDEKIKEKLDSIFDMLA